MRDLGEEGFLGRKPPALIDQKWCVSEISVGLSPFPVIVVCEDLQGSLRKMQYSIPAGDKKMGRDPTQERGPKKTPGTCDNTADGK